MVSVGITDEASVLLRLQWKPAARVDISWRWLL